MKATDKELKVLAVFMDDQCENIGKASGVGTQIWLDLEAKGWIAECTVCDDCGGYQITPLGESKL
ncbi:hypothetical protein [Profundibacter sp.]